MAASSGYWKSGSFVQTTSASGSVKMGLRRYMQTYGVTESDANKLLSGRSDYSPRAWNAYKDWRRKARNEENLSKRNQRDLKLGPMGK